MSYSITDAAVRALAAAQDEAIRLGHDYVGTEHLLLGVLRAAEPQDPPLLRALGIRAADVRSGLVLSAGSLIASVRLPAPAAPACDRVPA